MFNKIIGNINFIFTITLFCIGLYGLTIKKNLIKKLIGLNILETSIYLFFIALKVNPIPTGLILTAIVINVSVTILALLFSVKLYEHWRQ
ncbi:MAG: cation:proton antiporter subunit C [bacterium]